MLFRIRLCRKTHTSLTSLFCMYLSWEIRLVESLGVNYENRNRIDIMKRAETNGYETILNLHFSIPILFVWKQNNNDIYRGRGSSYSKNNFQVLLLIWTVKYILIKQLRSGFNFCCKWPIHPNSGGLYCHTNKMHGSDDVRHRSPSTGCRCRPVQTDLF